MGRGGQVETAKVNLMRTVAIATVQLHCNKHKHKKDPTFRQRKEEI